MGLSTLQGTPVSSWPSLKQSNGSSQALYHTNKFGIFQKMLPSSQKRPCLTISCSSSNNGSAFASRPDADSNEHPHKVFGTSLISGNLDSPSKASQCSKHNPGPVSKQIIENSIDKSHGSLEGVHDQQQQLTEQDQDKSLTSYEGNLHEDSTVANSVNKSGKQEAASISISESDSVWRSVFPAYMRSKDDEDDVTVSEDVHPNSNTKSMGLNGAAAAKAAAAAAASAKELESHVNSSANPSNIPSSSAPPCSSARNRTGGKKLQDLISDDPIWAAIRAEARLEAEREPLLSSFLYASILAHSCFERSLGFVLANRLKNATLLSTQLMDVLDDVFTKDTKIRQAVRLDVQAVKDRDPSCRSYSSALLYLKGYHALQSYRVAHVLWNRGQRVLALALQSRISEVFAVDIHPAARIGKAILLDHGTGVVIGETAVVGDRVSMLQGVTLGGTGKVAGDRHPKIGEGVLIGAGATILGNISVGRGAMVAAGSLVLKDVPPHSMVAGSPARVVGLLEEPTPSLTMKHDVTKDLWQLMGDDSVCGGTGI